MPSTRSPVPSFQSAPDGEVGGDSTSRGRAWSGWCFNQPPTVKSGETHRGDRRNECSGSFNQPPTVKSGETRGCWPSSPGPRRFNQPPTVKSGETVRYFRLRKGLWVFQSAPDGEVGGDGAPSGHGKPL